MSLVTDTDFLIHSLRLSYLRDVDDQYGPRIISLDPSYHINPYIFTAGLADRERWPELDASTSPNLSEDEQERPLGFPGARLKHTQTIMGGRSGLLGLRVNAKHTPSSKRLSNLHQKTEPDDVKNFLSDNTPVQEVAKNVPQSAPVHSWIKVEDSEAPEPTVQVHQATTEDEVPVTKVVQFIPKFKGAAEMEKRRQLRIAARRGAARIGPGPTKPVQPQTLSFDTSSEEEADVPVASTEVSADEEDEYSAQSAVDNMDGDEFDPVFATTRTANVSDSASDGASVFSVTAGSVPSSSFLSSSHTNNRPRPRLSPVSENAKPQHNRQQSKQGNEYGPRHDLVDPQSRSRSTSNTSSKSSHPTDNIFVKKKIQPPRTFKSSLTTMLASSGSSSNPFAEMYAAISGRGENAYTNVQVYFPHAQKPRGKPMNLNVRRDATVEEVIGFALWNFWEEGWLPKLDEGLTEDDSRAGVRLSAVGWILRIAEEDGEVDDDFPPADRTGKITKFNSEAYAILEANPTQVQQNQILESKIQRRPSRKGTKKSEKLYLPSQNMGASTPGTYGSTLTTSMLSSSLGPSSSHGPQIFLRIRVADTADAVHISTTIPVSAGMYMQEALELVCKKRKLQNPGDYALLLADMSILIPMDRTVASLQGKRELLLVKRSMLPQMGADIMKAPGKTTDPNASIFNTITDTPEQQYSSTLDYTAAYKKYTVYRKMPMLVTRIERTLAIDGVYVHIMPPNKAKLVFDHGRTTSFHIKSIADVVHANKTSSIFKLILNRGSATKRYDFEAESPKLAGEIVQTIKSLKSALERSGTLNKSRRSRQI